MASLNTIVSSVKKMIKGETSPAQILPTLLLLCVSLRRPGLSSMDITSATIRDYGQLGINTGPNPDGTPNLVNAATYCITKNIVDSLKMDCAVQCVIPAASLTITGTGGNAGGPVTITGTNTLPITIKGILS